MGLKWNRDRRSLEYAWAGILFALITGIAVFGRPLESLDELWQYSYGSNISKGYLPYRDINMVTTPLSQYVGAGALRIFGDCLLVYRGLGAGLGTLCMLLFYDILRVSGLERRLALCLSLYVCAFYSSCFTYDYNYLVLFFLLAMMDSMLRPLGRYSFVIGCLAGCAVMAKQSTGLILFLAVTFLRIFLREGNSLRGWALYGAGVLLPVGGGCAWMAGKGMWAGFLDYAFGGMKVFAGQNRMAAADFFLRSGALCTAEGILWMVILAVGLWKLLLCAGISPLPGRPGREAKQRRYRLGLWGSGKEKGNQAAVWEAREPESLSLPGSGKEKGKQAAVWEAQGPESLSLPGKGKEKGKQAADGEAREPENPPLPGKGKEKGNQAAVWEAQSPEKPKAVGDGKELRRRIIMAGLSLAGMAVAYPITDEAHFVIALFPFLIMGIYEISLLKTEKQTFSAALPLAAAVVCVAVSLWQIRGDEPYSSLGHLEGIRLDRDTEAQIEAVNAYLTVHAAGRPVYILDGAAVLYKIPMDLYDKDYDICNAGNWGSKTAEEVAEGLLQTGGLMLLAAEGYGVSWQVPGSFLEYIRERAECVGHVGKFDVYLAAGGGQVTRGFN